MVSRLEGLQPAMAQHVIAAAQALDGWRVDEAEQQLAAAQAHAPVHPEVLRLEAGIHSLRGHHMRALDCMQRALAQRPLDALYYNTLGTVLGTAGEFDAAIAALQRTCELQPDLAIAWYNLGVMFTKCVRNDDATLALQRAVALAPDHPAARALLGDMLRTNGHVEKATAQYRQVLAEEPAAGMAWWGLADLKTVPFQQGDIERMQSAMVNRTTSDEDRIAIGFALAKALDDAGRYADSMAVLAKANAIARQRQHWNSAGFSAGIKAINEAFAAQPPCIDDDLGREVIFVTSLPRSGSTLVEQILASHSHIEGAGELPDLPLVLAEESRRREQPFPQWVAAMKPADWNRLGRRYLERTAHWRRRRPIFIDKLPNNWMYIGAIRSMLPLARVLCCQRDPLETCFSCYRQRLNNNEYTRDFDDLASFWRDFDNSAQLWATLQASHVHLHSYEALLENPEAQIRRLLGFCNLPFEDGCLRFHETVREIRSPSATQVRLPLRQDTARAERYGCLLDPLRHALGQTAHTSPLST